MSESEGSPRTGAHAVPVITDARSPASVEHDSRVRRYAWTMAFRMACFVAMIFVEGPVRWVLFAGAVLLPYVAVTAANQVNQRGRQSQVEPGSPSDHPQLTTGPADYEVITGDVTDESEDGHDDGTGRDRKVA